MRHDGFQRARQASPVERCEWFNEAKGFVQGPPGLAAVLATESNVLSGCFLASKETRMLEGKKVSK